MMNIDWPKPGKYIVAVSGGVDSVCLLDMLVERGGYDLIVAHVDHGVRQDSQQDLQLVQGLASKYKLNIVITKLNFAKDASENHLRQARYKFLFGEMQKSDASAILTAHHADDLLETSILNVQRGTDRYGAAGGMSRKRIERPLINVKKIDLIKYVKDHQLEWREDVTNKDTKYARNKVRHEVVPRVNVDEYQNHLTRLADLNNKIDSQLAGLVSISERTITISRLQINQLGLREIEVLLAYAVRQIDPGIELSQPQIARLAREILLNTNKNSFSYGPSAGIIVDIQ